MKKPHVTVILPHFNQHGFLPWALDSIMAQRKPADLLVLVDDGSEDQDRVVEIFTPHQEKCYGQTFEFDPVAGLPSFEAGMPQLILLPKNKGSANAINAGFKRMLELRPVPEPTDCVTWVSSDNVQYPEWLSVLSGLMLDEDVGAVYSGYDACDVEPPGKPLGPTTYHYWPWEPNLLIEQEGCFYGPSFLIRRSIWEEAGGHRGRISHDYDHWARVEEVCAKHGRQILGLDAPLCRYGRHDGMATHRLRDQYDAPEWRQVALRRRGLL